MSTSFVEALDYLQGRMLILERSFNKMDFVGVWRSMVGGIDRLIFSGIYDGGVERLGNDLRVLFAVFEAWCLRPEGFFPKVSEGLRFLKLGEEQLHNSLKGGER